MFRKIYFSLISTESIFLIEEITKLIYTQPLKSGVGR
jgi:hypothetical protein